MGFLNRLFVKDKACTLAQAKPTRPAQSKQTSIRVLKTCSQCHKVCIVKNNELDCPLCGAVDGLDQVK